jgi:hypothetical protein
VHVYTAAGGVQDLLSPGSDPAVGFDDLGTDGTDMVWMKASGHTDASLPFDKYEIITSPATTDPALIAPRRLRSEEGPAFGSTPFVVGCGYAARTNGYHLRIVRLADGQSWNLDGAATDAWSWARPLAVTCDELFATVKDGKTLRLARVRLDSLGPPIPAD